MFAAAKLIEPDCDAIDLNLGCPQRIAHAGHFGSYLLGDQDRPLVLSIVKRLALTPVSEGGLKVPVFVKVVNFIPRYMYPFFFLLFIFFS
jgi:tRNA-dihydrouridine synthase 1